MTREQRTYRELAQELISAHADVEPGKMMSSDALKVNGKVFAFYREGAMVFKLGKAADTERPELAGWEWLNPFKTKPPLKAWYQVPLARKQHWRALAGEALELVRAGG